MHKHHRDEAGLVGTKSDELALGLGSVKNSFYILSTKECLEFHFPNIRVCQHHGQRSGGFRFEGNVVVLDAHRSHVIGGVKPHETEDSTLSQLTSEITEPQY